MKRHLESKHESVGHQEWGYEWKMEAREWNLCSTIPRTIVQIVEQNRRASTHRSHLSLIPLEKLFPGRNDILVYRHPNIDLPDTSSLPQRRPGPDDPHWKIPATEWPIVLHRIDQGEPLRKVQSDYGISYETVRRVIQSENQRTDD